MNALSLPLPDLGMSATTQEWLVEKPATVVVYLLLALAVRWLFHRAIDRVTTPGPGGEAPRPWRRRTDRDDGHARSPDQSRTDRKRAERRTQRLATIGSVLKSLVSLVVLVWVVLQTLAIIGVNVAPFIASAGIVGVALGFGAQTLVRDFLSGLFMLFEDQYGVGDWVDVGEAEGTVEYVGLRITVVRDLHGTLWYCRNGDIQRVGNHSQDFGVALLEIPLPYGTDVDRACAVAVDTAREASAQEPIRSHLVSAPELLGVTALDAEGWSLRMTAVTRANWQWVTERELRRRLLSAFAEAGIVATAAG